MVGDRVVGSGASVSPLDGERVWTRFRPASTMLILVDGLAVLANEEGVVMSVDVTDIFKSCSRSVGGGCLCACVVIHDALVVGTTE